tara:strand:+ start:1648 stop:2196 length:549 start_codon:yes stop_codon:yes gene_type:complete
MRSKLSIIFIVFMYSNCGTIPDNTFQSNRISGIVKIKNFENSLARFTDRNQRNSIKALPIIISTGFAKDSTKFTLIEFKSYNKNKPINYSKIEMYNAEKHKWEWIVDSKKKDIIENKYFIEERYKALITSQENELYNFFNFPPVYLKFIGDQENFKKLEHKHLKSLQNILKYAENLDFSLKL